MFNTTTDLAAKLFGQVRLAESLPVPAPASLPAPREEHDQLKDFEHGLRKLHEAIVNNKGAREQLEAFKQQGTWDSFWGGLTGKNDKDLADMVRQVGESLAVTQSVVQLLTQLHTANNKVLRGFNDALVREIERLQADAVTLEGNQEGVLVVLCEFKQQIDDLLAMADGYAYCTQEVERLAWAQGKQETELTALDAKIDAQHQKLVTSTLARVQKEAVIRKNLEHHQHKIAAQEGQLEELKKNLNASNLARESLSTTVTTALKKLALATSTQAQRVDRMEAQLATLLDNQRQCQAQLAQLAAPGWVAYLGRNAVSLVALAAAVFALGLNLRG
ncbi:hypothetical protein ACIOWB_13420 [Pseudomonas capeferrum]|uniref:hypothetical protein n=1 Tax=Pseudomonas capeferrum TaxID=1495066 RepID=UPI003803E84F